MTAAKDERCGWLNCEDEWIADDIPMCQFHIDMAWAIRNAQQLHQSKLYKWARGRTTPTGETMGLVYYVRMRGADIKIGHTMNLKERMSGLRLTMEEVLAAEPGGRRLEQQRHREFAALRRQPQWEDFAPHPGLDRHIAEVRERHGDPQKLWEKQMAIYRKGLETQRLDIVLPNRRRVGGNR